MKKRYVLAYLTWFILLIVAGIFDNHYPDFPVRIIHVVALSLGVIVYLFTKSLSGFGDCELALYDKYAKDHRDQKEKDVYVQSRVNIKGFIILVLIPILVIVLEYLTNK